MRSTTSRAMLISLAGTLLALLALPPTGAQAAPVSLRVSTSDAVSTGSCDFNVSRYNENGLGPATVTGRLTIKGAEVKQSFLAPRRIATLAVTCYLYSGSAQTNEPDVILQKIANASTVYKSRYVEVPASGTYQVCISVEYILKNGAFGGAPGACNPALPA